MVSLKIFLLRPRYLRAIPSLVVLTTAMAWADARDLDVADDTDTRAKVVLVQQNNGKPDVVNAAI